MDWLVGSIWIGNLLIAPYTKVEESFNLQACHDILYHGVHLDQYDHLEFPGVVPRTFIGPLVVSGLAAPLVTIIKLLGLSKFISQMVVRFVLGLLGFLAWRNFRHQVEESFGSKVTFWFTIITASQFHFLYYLSRPLPNIFALVLALLAFSAWMDQHHGRLILMSGLAVLIFRSELCLLLGPMLLTDLATKRLEILKFLRYAIPSGLLCLGLTLSIDSIFWQHLLWPEGEVFWFNTYQNQSRNWGIYPFLWYWYSALPRALGFSLLLVPIGIALDRRVRVLLTPALVFVALYSFMPHKELRFIIYVFPLFNVAAARAVHFFWEGRDKTFWRQVLAVGCTLHLLCNAALTGLLVTISSANYPGGVAIQKFHEIVPESESVNLHIDNLSAQSGISRFTQLNDNWRYNKTENLQAGGLELRKFTHLLVEAKSKFSYNLKKYKDTHEILASVEAFSHLNFNYQHFPPVRVRVKPTIFILKNLVEEDIKLFEDIPTIEMEEILPIIEEENEKEKKEDIEMEEILPIVEEESKKENNEGILPTNQLLEEPLPVIESDSVVNEPTKEEPAVESFPDEGGIVEEIGNIVEAVAEKFEEIIIETVGTDIDVEDLIDLNKEDGVLQDVENTPVIDDGFVSDDVIKGEEIQVEKELVLEDGITYYNDIYIEENKSDDSVYDNEMISSHEDDSINVLEENNMNQEEERKYVEVTFPEEMHSEAQSDTTSQVSEEMETLTSEIVVPDAHESDTLTMSSNDPSKSDQSSSKNGFDPE